MRWFLHIMGVAARYFSLLFDVTLVWPFPPIIVCFFFFYRSELCLHLELGLLSADVGIWSDFRFVLPGLGFTTCLQLISLLRTSVFMSIIFVLHLTCVMS